MAKILSIKDLHVDVASTPIINGLNLEIESGETHAIMGPNGSGKSTLAKTIAGHPDYKIKSGEITYMDHDLNDLPIEERSNLGVFLGFQYPIEIPGLSNTAFLKAAINAKRKYNGLEELSASDFLIDLKEKSKMVEIEQKFLSRALDRNFCSISTIFDFSLRSIRKSLADSSSRPLYFLFALIAAFKKAVFERPGISIGY